MKELQFKFNPLFVVVFLLFSFTGMFLQLLLALSLVFVHELAHVIAAYWEGFSIQKIELFPFGGVAEYSGLLALNPGAEIRVAVAGPLLNLLLAFLFWLSNWEILFYYNLILAGFNLLPALPLDGGRIFRALLVKKRGFCRGTTGAIRLTHYLVMIGFLIAMITVYLGKASFFVLLIFFFIYSSVVREKKQYVYKFFTYLTRREDYLTEIETSPIFFQAVKMNLNLRNVLSLIRPDRFNLFYVLNNNLRVISVIGEVKLLDAFFSRGNNKNELLIRDIIEE